MSAPFTLPRAVEQPEVPAVEVYEPCLIQADYVDGASHISVLPDGLGHINLWRYHLSSDGGVERILAARLVMRPHVMRGVALAMLSSAMVGQHLDEDLRRKMD